MVDVLSAPSSLLPPAPIASRLPVEAQDMAQQPKTKTWPHRVAGGVVLGVTSAALGRAVQGHRTSREVGSPDSATRRLGAKPRPRAEVEAPNKRGRPAQPHLRLVRHCFSKPLAPHLRRLARRKARGPLRHLALSEAQRNRAPGRRRVVTSPPKTGA